MCFYENLNVFGASLEHIWGILGIFVHFYENFGVFVRLYESLGDFGASLECLWGVTWASCGFFECLYESLGVFRASLGRLYDVFEVSLSISIKNLVFRIPKLPTDRHFLFLPDSCLYLVNLGPRP